MSFWVSGAKGISDKLQELDEVKNQGVHTWQVLDQGSGRYIILVELNTWVKRKKKK